MFGKPPNEREEWKSACVSSSGQSFGPPPVFRDLGKPSRRGESGPLSVPNGTSLGTFGNIKNTSFGTPVLNKSFPSSPSMTKRTFSPIPPTVGLSKSGSLSSAVNTLSDMNFGPAQTLCTPCGPSFYSTKSSQEIMELIRDNVPKKNLDLHLESSKTEIKGRYFEDHDMAEFQINVFEVDETGHFPGHRLVEFMKVSGSGFVFQKWFLNVMTKLYDVADLVKHSDIDKGQSMVGTLKSIGAFDLESDKSVLEDILDMCETGSIELCRSSARILAQQSENHNVKLMLSQITNLLKRLTNVMEKCLDAQVVRGLAHTMVQLVRDVRGLRDQGIKLNLKKQFEQLCLSWIDPANASTQDHFLRKRLFPSREIDRKLRAIIVLLS